MSVAAISMLKDESDIVEWFVRHMATQVDSLIVSDNGSTDGTREILAELAADGLISTVYDDPQAAYFQSRKMSWLAARARESGFDWVVAADCDERWVAEDGRSIRDWLRGIAPDVGYVKARVFHFIPSVEDDPTEPNPFRRIGWRLAEPSPLPKIAARLVPGLVIEAGNHGAHVERGHGPELIPLGGGGLRVDHYSWRSAGQFAKKIQNGARAYALTDLPEGIGSHWRMWGDPDAQDLPARASMHFRKFFWAEDPPRAPGSCDSNGLVFDPAPLRKEAEIVDEDQTNSWKEVHDDVEAALFAVNDLDAESFDGGPRIKAIVATKLEEAFLWVKRGMEKGGAG